MRYTLNRYDIETDALVESIDLDLDVTYSPGRPWHGFDPGEPEEVEILEARRADTGEAVKLSEEEEALIVDDIIDDLRREESDYRQIMRANNRRPLLSGVL